jgi:hypothetical protein
MDETHIGGKPPRFISPLFYRHNWAKVGCLENISRQLPQLIQTW